EGQWVRPEALGPPAGRPVRRPPGEAARWRAVDRPEGGPVRPRPVGDGSRPGDRVAVAAEPRVHPPGAPPQPPPVGRPTDPPAVEKNLRRRVRRLRAAHTGKRLAVPPNVALHFLPPCTPELQPVEPFWALVREAVANDSFDRLADLRRVVRRRCRRLARDRATVLGAIGFHWAVNLEA